MPLYDYFCARCGKSAEVYAPSMESLPPVCCGEVMVRRISGRVLIKMGYPGWINRMDEIHKAQAARGERLRIVEPWEIGAT